MNGEDPMGINEWWRDRKTLSKEEHECEGCGRMIPKLMQVCSSKCREKVMESELRKCHI